MPTKLKPLCTICNSPYHYQTFCPQKANKTPARATKSISREATKHRAGRLSTQAEWRDAHPPDEYGYWLCYLRVVPECWGRVDLQTINYEHKESRARRPDLANDPKNIGPACGPCNKFKGSRCLSELVDQFPHLIPELVQ